MQTTSTNILSEPDLAALSSAPVALEEEINQYRQWRTSSDLYTRGRTGPVFYLIACMLISWLAAYYQQWPGISAGITAFYLLLWYLRYQCKPPVAHASADAFQAWKKRYWLLVHITSISWGISAVTVCYLQRDIDSAMMTCLLSTIAFGTAASHVFSMNLKQARLSLLALVLPPALYLLSPQAHLQATGITLAFYLLYLLANSRRAAQEYGKQIETEIMLINSRAELVQLSLIDTLTGLPNRRSYENAWQQAWQLASRRHESLCLLVLDLDHFKQINDQHGHLGGDACLRHFATLLKRHMRRDSDIIARIGGEEFVAILSGTSIEQACDIANQLRLDLMQNPCEFEQQHIPMTVSIGVGHADWQSDATASATFSRVDRACYQAKNEGRNRVLTAK